MIPFEQNLSAADLKDDELIDRLRRFAHGSRLLLAGFLVHLQSFDERRLHEPRGFQSLFHYCTTELRFSADEAYLRIYAARLAKAYPRILGMLGRGELHLSGLSRLGPRLTADNAEELLSRASGKSKRDIERLCAPPLPGPPPRDKIKFLAAAVRPRAPSRPGGTSAADPADAAEPATVAAPKTCADHETSAPPEALANPAPITAPESLAPATPAPRADTYRLSTEEGRSAEAGGAAEEVRAGEDEKLVQITFIASEGLWVKIERAKALLRHKHPLGRLEDVLSDAVGVLLAKIDPAARLAAARQPGRRAPRPGKRIRRIRRTVKDAVWLRDGGRCAFVSPEGRRCDAVEFLEYDHIKPWASGGASDDPANIRLLCRTHNALTARAIFGDRRRRRATA